MVLLEGRPDVGFEFHAMGTVCHLRLCAPDDTVAAAAAQLAIDEVRRLEAKYSRYRTDSIVSRINAAAGSGCRVPVDTETAGLLGFADKLFEASGGRFDITSGILRRVWDFKSARLPDAESVAALLPAIGWPMVDWDGETLALQRPGMELDFGGFAKEYAADRAAACLHAAGITGGTVNLGGDVSIVGPDPSGSPWKIGIAHPRQPGEVIASIDLSHGALATSGDYERAFDVGGRRYCHILDPRTGWPVTHWRSVSVVGPACLASGALSTIAMLMGGAAHGFLREQGVGFLTIDAAGQLHREQPVTDLTTS